MTRLPSGLLTYVEKAIVIPSAKSTPARCGGVYRFCTESVRTEPIGDGARASTVLFARSGCLRLGVKAHSFYEGYDFLFAVDVQHKVEFLSVGANGVFRDEKPFCDGWNVVSVRKKAPEFHAGVL